MNNIYLCKPDRSVVCAINNIDPTTVSFTKNLTDLWELSFSVKRYDDKQNQTDFYESISGGMWVYLDTEKDKGYFIIDSDPEIEVDGITETKTVTCHSCECEMQKKFLKRFKVNTGELNLSLEYLVTDKKGNFVNVDPYTQLPYRYITLVDYDTPKTDYFTGNGEQTEFELSFVVDTEKRITVEINKHIVTGYTVTGSQITFNTAPALNDEVTVSYVSKDRAYNKQLSLLDLIIEKAELTGWTVDPNISEKLQKEYYTFDVDEQDIYSFFTQQLAATARVLVTFDRVNMVIGLVDEEEIGKDTGAFLTYRNLLNNLKKTPANETGIITKYYPTGKDGLGIEYVNFGQDYMLDLNYYAHAKDEYGNYKYMSEEMSQRWDDYVEDIDVSEDDYEVVTAIYDSQTDTYSTTTAPSGETKTRRELFAQYTRDYNDAYLKRTEIYDRLPIDGLVIDYTTYKCYELLTAYKAYMNALNALVRMYNLEHSEDTPVDPSDESTWNDTFKKSFYWLDFESYVKGIIPKIFEAFKIWCKTYTEKKTDVVESWSGAISMTLTSTPMSIVSVKVNGNTTTKYNLVGNDIVFSSAPKSGDKIEVEYVINAYLLDKDDNEIILDYSDNPNSNVIVTSREKDETIGAVNEVVYNDTTIYYTNLVTFEKGLTPNKDYTDANIVRNIEWYLYEPSLYGLDEINAKITAWKGVVDTTYKEGFEYYPNETSVTETGDGTTTQWTLNPVPQSIKTITIDGEATSSYTLYKGVITFSTPPESGKTIVFEYFYGDKVYNTPDDQGYERVSKDDFPTESLFKSELNLYLDYVSPTPRQNGLVGGTSIGVIPLFEEVRDRKDAQDKNPGRLQEIDKYTALMEKYDELREDIQDDYTYTNYFTEEEREIFNPLISESAYTNENFLITNLDDIVTTVAEEQELYDYAKKELNKVAQPQWHFDISADNLFKLSEYKPVADEVDVGNWVRVQTNLYKDKFVKLRIMSYQYNPLDISPELTLTFSNITYSYNKMSDLDYIFSNMGGTTGGSSTGGTGGSSGTYGENDAEINLSNTMLNALLSSDNYNNMLNNKINLFVGSLTADYIKSRIIEAEEITVGGKIKIDSDGVTVGYGQSGYSYVSDAGLDVYKDSIKVAKFGNTSEIQNGNRKMELDANGMSIYNTTTSPSVKTASFGDTVELISGTKKATVDSNGLSVLDGNIKKASFGDTAELISGNRKAIVDSTGLSIYKNNNRTAFWGDSTEFLSGDNKVGVDPTKFAVYASDDKEVIVDSEGLHVIDSTDDSVIAEFGDNILLNGGTITLDNGSKKAVINSNGMIISSINNNTETPIASFGTETVIKTTDGTELAHFGYAEGQAESGTAIKPYYTFGRRKRGTMVGNWSVAEGDYTEANAHGSHAEGFQTIASGTSSHAEGGMTKASGSDSHAEGSETEASSNCAHAEGNQTKANGSYSHAEGDTTVAAAQVSHAEGKNTKVEEEGWYSHVEGWETFATSVAAHAEGRGTRANNSYSHAGGLYTQTSVEAQTVIGKYNNKKSNTLFEVGNGTADNARSNAFEVTSDGYICTGIGMEKIAFGVTNGEYGYYDSSGTFHPFDSSSIVASQNRVNSEYAYTVYDKNSTLIFAVDWDGNIHLPANKQIIYDL